MTPILGRPLTSYIFVVSQDPAAVNQGEKDLMQTAITQPAMLTVDAALQRLLADFGFRPDYVMGHSLGEYSALVASGALSFESAAVAIAKRSAAMQADCNNNPGAMAAIMGLAYEKIVEAFGGYGERVEDPEDIVPALRRAVKAVKKEKRQALLNVICKHP